MRRPPSSPLVFALWFLPLAALAGAGVGCAAYRYQHAPSAGPRHEAAESLEPGREFRELPPETQAARVRGELAVAKEEAARRGDYHCCIRPACDHCMLEGGKCTCGDEVEMMGPGCGECTQGWLEGRGAVPGVDIWKVLEERLEEHRHGSPPTEESPPPGR